MGLLNIAHRGASGYAPENTRAAFALAIEMGADMIETDVQVTRDGELVLVHDTNVDRVSDGAGPVANFTLAELRCLDLGGWFDPRFSGERVMTLAEFITEFVVRLPAVLEIKAPNAAVPLVEAIVGAGIGERVQVTSFSWSAVLEAHATFGGIAYGFLTPVFDRTTIERCVDAGLDQICPHVDALTPDLVDFAHANRLFVRAYGVSRREQLDGLRASGAEGATVNWPDWLRAG